MSKSSQANDELALRDQWMAKAKEVKNLDDFTRLYHELANFKHDYGTICRAMAALGVAGTWLLDHSPQGGITGFQAGCIMWDLITGWMSEYHKKPLRLLDYSQLLYPQYLDKFRHTIGTDTAKWLRDEATKHLADSEHAHPDVLAHWKKVESGWLPEFVTVQA